MVSGYLQALFDNEPIDFRQFVLLCAKQSGVVVYEADTPVDLEARWRPSDSHQLHIDEAEIEIGLLVLLPVEECQWRTEIEWLQAQAEDAADRVTKATRRARYLWMLNQVHNWKAPEPCEGLRQWMIDHIQEGVSNDCRHVPSAPEAPLTVDEWRDSRVRRLESLVACHRGRLAAELAECERKRALALALHESLFAS